MTVDDDDADGSGKERVSEFAAHACSSNARNAATVHAAHVVATSHTRRRLSSNANGIDMYGYLYAVANGVYRRCTGSYGVGCGRADMVQRWCQDA